MRQVLIAILLSLSWVAQAQDKLVLVEQILTRSQRWEDIERVMDIVMRSEAHKHVPLGVPIKEQWRESSSFGYRVDPINGGKKWHSGIDLAAQYASIVYSTADGKVVFSGTKGGYGKMIILQHKYGFETCYAHLTYLYAELGSEVKRGRAIGFVGSTGRSTGNHLHYEIRKYGKVIDPKKFMIYRI